MPRWRTAARRRARESSGPESDPPSRKPAFTGIDKANVPAPESDPTVWIRVKPGRRQRRRPGLTHRDRPLPSSLFTIVVIIIIIMMVMVMMIVV